MGLLFFITSTSAQLLINEICPTNYVGIQNSTGENDDWIELYNSSASTLNIAGYGLSDDSTKRYAFSFPSYTLNAGARVLVFASGKTNNVIVNHWEMAVNAQTAWRYASGSASLDTNWRNRSFNQNAWSSGNGGIGFSDGDDGTTVPVGVSVMMRKMFSIPDTALISKAILMMDYDDGFVAYLNGVEIARANLGTPNVRPLWNDVASGSHEAQRYQGLPIDSFYLSPKSFKSLLRPDSNVLAIEVHNSTPTGSDLSSIPYLFFGMTNSSISFSAVPSWFVSSSQDYFSANFKLDRNGEKLWLTSPGGATVDSKVYPAMQTDNSIGRKPDGSSTWCFISTPTPNASNNGSTCYTNYAGDPIFSIAGGFYTNSQSLTLINTTPGGSIRYTTNGDEPKTTSPLYTGPITVSSPKAIRAKVFASGYLPSKTITNSYFIGASTHLPTFSITTDSLNLWDYNTGIYVLGPNAESTSPYKGANFWQDWEKPASIEFYDRNKNLVVRFGADIKIYGNYTRANPKKSFEIKPRDHYGLGSFTYPIFPDKPYVTDIDNIVLRNGGTGTSKINFRDAFMQRMLKTTYSGYLATDPTVLYLNGEYWGVYHINENHDHHWMKDNFGFENDEIDHLKERGSGMEIQRGSDASFWTLYNYAITQSPTSSQYYNQIDAQLDLKNYTDYFAAETFYNNGDWMGPWTNNIQLWRPKHAGGKWKYLVYDLDFGLGYSGSVTDNRLQIARNPTSFCYSSEMFDAILNNPTYKRYFINRYADLMNTIWLPANANSIMHSYKDTIDFDMPADKARWGGTISQWNTYINDMMTFESGRLSVQKNYIKSEFNLQSIVTLTLKVSPANSGRIEISTITPTTYPWTGDYFNGNPVTITAIPNPGYTFNHWNSTIAMTTNNPNQSVTYNFTGNDQITAYFTGSAVTPQLCVSEFNYNSDSAYDAGDWIELHNYGTTSLNLSGWWISDSKDNHKFQIPTGTVIPANGYLVVSEDTVKFKSQFPNVSVLGTLGFNYGNGGDQVRIFNHNNAIYLTFNYLDIAPWPLAADGGGYTCELTSNTANPNNSSSWFAGCLGGSPGRAYSGLLLAPVSISGSSTLCNGQNATLNASTGIGYSYQWKKNGVYIPGATDSSLVVNQLGSYSVTITSQGCSNETAPVVVSVITQQQPPQATSASRCGSGDITLYASSNDTVFWYTAATNGTLLGYGDSLTIPILNSSTIYYARTGSVCQSASVPVNANILPQAAAPVTNINVSRCGPGPITLTATDTAQIRWYNQSNAGGLLETGSTFITNPLFNDTTFYVEAGTVCPSARVEVFVSVVTAPSVNVNDTSRCGNGSMVLTGISPYPVTWYSEVYGGSLLGSGNLWTTPPLAVTDTFYAEAINNGCASVRQRVIAIVYNIPGPPVVSDTIICSSGSINLNATATEQVRWYSASSGGTLLNTGSSFNTPIITGTTIYYVENGYFCPSSRVPLTINIGTPAQPPNSTNAARCGAGSVTLYATSPELIYWYDAPIAGNLLITSDTYVTPSISFTTTYYAEAGTTCRSLSRTPVKAIINSIPATPAASSTAICGPGTATITTSSNDTVYWFNAPTGGPSFNTGLSYTASFSNSTTYYLEAANICRSSRIPVQVTVAQQPASPNVINGSRCGSGSVSLSASSANTVNWYSSPAGGTLLTSGLTYNTPTIASTTTYYASAFNGCESPRVPVIATVNPVPVTPTVLGASLCGSGSVSLNATSPDPMNWYSFSVGGSSIATGTLFNTGVIASTTTYYVESGTTCKSPRVPVVAVINTIPTAPSLISGSNCGPGTVTLTATTSSPIVNWYSVPSGGISLGNGLSYTTPTISTTTTYYAQATSAEGCTSSRVAVEAVISNTNSAPITTGASRCGSGSLSLSAVGLGTVNWYNTISGGTILSTGNIYTINSISTTTTYYAEANNNGCLSPRVPVIAQVDPQPAAPVSSGAFSCNPASLTITATSPEQINWYTVPSGGTSFFTGTIYTTPLISSTVTYYLDAGVNCKSPRVPVLASINSNPSSPAVINGNNCGPGNVILTAVSPSPVNWFNTPSGGTAVGTGLSYTTPSISSTTTYYAEAGILGCFSPRVPVVAFINSIPSAPSASGNSKCGPGSLPLSATGAGQLYWYTAATGGTLLDSGATYNTPNLNSSVTYFVETRFANCPSVRSAAVATIVPIPAAPSANDVSKCGPGIFTLTASSPEQIYWYSAPTGGTLLTTGSTYTTPSISTNTTYYVEAGNTCRSARIAVRALIATPPNAPALIDTSRCGPGTLVIQAISNNQVNWYAVPSGGSLLDTGAYFITPFISATTTYYAEAGIGCNSIRVPVTASIVSAPAPPNAADVTRCGFGSVNLTATSSQQIYWYDAASGGTQVGTGASFTTPPLSNTTTYYVETGDAVCHSARVSVQAILGGTQVNSIIEGAICGSGTVVLSASSSQPVDSISWYDQPGGNLLGTGQYFVTPNISATTPYYAVAYSSCTGLPLAVNAFVFPMPSFSLGADTVFLQSGQSLTIDAGPGFSSYGWSTSETTQSISVSTGGMVTVAITDANGCPATDSVYVEVVTGISSIDGKDKLVVYPNPTHEQLIISLPESSDKYYSLKVLSMDGKILIAEDVKNSFGKQQNKVISFHNIAAGVYILELLSDDYSATVKVFVQ